MAEEQPLPDAESVHGFVQRICFKTGPPGRLGAELEWPVARRHDTCSVVPLGDIRALLDGAEPFPGMSRVTIEPGGQVELSSAPAADLTACHEALSCDVAHLETVLSTAGLLLVPAGLDPNRPPVVQLREPRYDAMAAYFDTLPHGLGRIMMSSTAAVQVNVDVGADLVDVAGRWELLHLVGPTLSGAFANSPRRHGRFTGWKSTRQAVWLHLDPRRTHAPGGDDPATAWSEYALAAPVMMLRTEQGRWLASPGFTFGDWVAGRVPGQKAPTEDDLSYHLSTLFPPVRPRGWFEVRYLDAQAPQWWPVPVAVLATLLHHPDAAAVATEACAPVAGAWFTAARRGLDDVELARAAQAIFESVVDLVDEPSLRATVVAFMDRYVGRGRCPADDAFAPPVHTARRSWVGVPTTPLRSKQELT